MSPSTRRASTTTIAMLLVVGPLLTPVAMAATDLGPFSDDDGHPGEPYIEWLAGVGALDGCDPVDPALACPDQVVDGVEALRVVIRAGRLVGLLPAITPVPGSDLFAAPLHRGQLAMLLVDVLGLEAPGWYPSPWRDATGEAYEAAARVAAFHRIWDSSTGRLDGDAEVTRAELSRTVAVAVGEDPCPANPFTTARVASLERRFPGQSFAGYVFDTRTGCAFWLNPEARLRTASVFKVMVMAGTLLEAQRAARPLSNWELSQLEPMITESANDPVRALWSHFGGAPWFREQSVEFGLEQTTTVGDSERGWGRTTTSGKDQGDLIRQVLLGGWGPIDDAYRGQAWDLMTSVVPEQTWGITHGVPDGWVVAQKNGFAGHIANSVGFVRQPDGSGGYIVVVLTNGWSAWSRGVPVVEEISGWVAASLAR